MKGQRNDLRWAQHLLPPVQSQRRESKAKRLRWKVRKEKDTEIKKTCRESRKQETARKKVKGTVPVRRENVGASTSTVKFWSYMSYWFWGDAGFEETPYGGKAVSTVSTDHLIRHPALNSSPTWLTFFLSSQWPSRLKKSPCTARWFSGLSYVWSIRKY